MYFADNKTKTWHDREENWSVGNIVTRLRYLGYWLETPPPAERLLDNNYQVHLNHWITKANLSFNMIRGMCQRSKTGLNTTGILRILQSCTHSMLTYGIEIWGHDIELTKTADSLMYGAIKRLFDLPMATSHRAISNEFGFIPMAIRYQYNSNRMA